MFSKKDPMLHLVKTALMAAVIGLASGLLLALVIWYIMTLVSGDPTQQPPAVIVVFLGMGVGTTLGAILGGIAGLKK